ncbi:MAG: response regulator [Selenomonadaceae bacterium]|nr:response regulator [Selenomonadaceae bacterium]
MNELGFSLNEKYVRKIIAQFVVLLVVLILAGLFIRAEVNSLLNETLEKTMAKQASDLAIVAEERFAKELSELKMAAHYFEAHPDAHSEENFLSLLKAANDKISVGLLHIDGKPIYGRTVSKLEFARFPNAYRGSTVVDYCAGKGLLFAVPVMNGGNVRGVIYRLYDEDLLADLFGLSEYHSEGRLLIQERQGQIVVPYRNYGREDRFFFRDKSIRRGFRDIRQKLATNHSAAVYCESVQGRFFLFATDLPQTNCSMIGYVPWASVAGDIFRIYTLLLFGGTLMLIFLALVSAYLFVMRTKAEESDELREAKRIADEANNAKSAFLANMSHEIRTPINAVLGMNEMILRESKNPAVIGYAQNSAAASEALLSIINDILDFSKIESGKLELVEERYRLDEVIKSLVNMIRPRADKKSLTFTLKVNPAIQNFLYGDAVRIRQIGLNLLSNAVKYTKFGGVEFIVDKEDNFGEEINLKFTVKDTGIGIREADLGKIFNDFERFDLQKNKNIEGTGLGLAITHKLITMMEGKIEVHSVYGEGSTFSVTIPQKILGADPVGEISIKPVIKREEYKPLFTAPDARILVVDDNEMNLLVAVNLLKSTKVQVDTAISGMVCLQKLTERHYDLILMDQMMPSLDGIQTLKMALALENNLSKHSPVIALTANAISGTREMLLREGFSDYLSKPIDVKVMEQMLMNYLPVEKLREPDSAPAPVATPPVKAPEPVPAPKVPDESLINVKMGLEYSAGMNDLYKEILVTFVELKDEKINQLQTAFDGGDWKNYTIYIHALKSTALSIGGEKTSALAKELEMSGKAITSEKSSDAEKAQGEEFIRQNHAEAMRLYEKLAQEAKRVAESL